MSKTVWIINEYAGSPYHGMGVRHFYLAKSLKEFNYNPLIITASYSHLLTNFPVFKENFHLENIDGVDYCWIKVPAYKNGHSLGRLIKWLVFSLKLPFVAGSLVKKWNPDIIIASTAEMFHLVPAIYLSKKLKAHFVYEVRDIWPLSLIELGGYSELNPLVNIMRLIESFAYSSSTFVIHLNSLGCNYPKVKTRKKPCIYLPNGVVSNSANNCNKRLIEEIRNEVKNKFVVMYVGSMGRANALEYLVQAGHILIQKGYGKSIQIIMVGDGSEASKLKKLKEDLKISNLSFVPRVPKDQVGCFLQIADILYIGWRNLDIYQYGISANKIFEYMISGKPILHSYSGKGDSVQLAKCGITVPAEDPNAIADGILMFYRMPEKERIKLGENGRRYIIQNHDYKILAKKLADALANIQ